MSTPVITGAAAKDLQLGKNGSYSNEGNILQHTLYDTLLFQDATLRATSTFFQVPIGTTKGLQETNLTDPSKLPNGQTFLVKEISLAGLFGAVGTDVDAGLVMGAFINIIQNSIFEFKIAGREFDLQKPGTEFLAPYAIAARQTVVTATDRANAGLGGSIIATGRIKLSTTPIPIGQLVTFQVIQRSGSATAAIATILDTASDVLNTQDAQLQVRLHGILTRAI